MRYVVYGAGAVGGAVGGRLAAAGRSVVLVARGAHLQALRRQGLRLLVGDAELPPPVAVAGSAAEAAPEPGDVVLRATKSQDTESALADIDTASPGAVAVVCAQNGVANEPAVLRRGLPAYGQCVVVGATHLEPGVVALHAGAVSGVLDLGRFPDGADELAEQVAADLGDATFESVARPRIMRWKYAKLLGNLGNALDAAVGRHGWASALHRRARAEVEAMVRRSEEGPVESGTAPAPAEPVVRAAV